MDWSLVLLSQAIEATIESGDHGLDWHLLVAAQDRERALEAIRLYQFENRRPRWSQEVIFQGLLFDWVSLVWLILLGVFFWVDASRDLFSAGAMDPVAVTHHQWWRLFTAVWLHADLGHLVSNATIGLVLLGLVMGSYGTGAGMLAAYLAGVGGNLCVWLLTAGSHLSLGASGMVMGCLGLLAAQSVWLWRHGLVAAKSFWSGLGGGLMLFVLLGLAPGTDVVAHAGGFATGIIFGALLALRPSLAVGLLSHPGELAEHAKTPAFAFSGCYNLLCGVIFAWLVVWPWWRALHSVLFHAMDQ
jgi:membrane associated rhomboid family serine protease